MKRLGVHSTWIVKNNSSFFPQRPLLATLKARYDSNVAGKWVTMQTTIAGVNLIAVAYAWSKKGVSYFISTCGNTCPSFHLYRSKFEDEFGGASYKDIQRPEICEFLYEYLPIIDEHNKQRQNVLNLEKCWATKCCWFRLCTTLFGKAVTDMYRVYRHHDIDTYQNMGVVSFSDKICAGLKQRSEREAKVKANGNGLIRIRNSHGEMTKAIKGKASKTRNLQGSSVQGTCWICRLRSCTKGGPQTRNRKRKYKYTSYCCKDCLTPLCNELNPKDGYELTCFDEHMNSTNVFIRCNGSKKIKTDNCH